MNECGYCRVRMVKNTAGRFFCPECTMERFFEEVMSQENKCWCGDRAFSHQKYCSGCGRNNPRFDELALIVEWGKTLSEMQEQVCFREAHEDMRELDFCAFCGEGF